MPHKSHLKLITIIFSKRYTIWMSRKLRSRRQTSIADKVLKTIQENCDVKIICEGKEVIDQMINYCTSEHFKDNITSKMSNEIDEYRDFVPIKRLLPNPLWLFRTKFVLS